MLRDKYLYQNNSSRQDKPTLCALKGRRGRPLRRRRSGRLAHTARLCSGAAVQRCSSGLAGQLVCSSLHTSVLQTACWEPETSTAGVVIPHESVNATSQGSFCSWRSWLLSYDASVYICNHLHMQKFQLRLYSTRYRRVLYFFISLIQKHFTYHGDICCF